MTLYFILNCLTFEKSVKIFHFGYFSGGDGVVDIIVIPERDRLAFDLYPRHPLAGASMPGYAPAAACII